MLCGKPPQGTRRDTCFKIKHFLIWLIHFVTKRSFSTVTVSVSQPGLDWDQKITLAFLFMAVHHIQYGKTCDIPEDICACCAISFFFLKSAAAYKDERTMLKNDMLCHYSGIHLGRHGHTVTIPTFKWKWMSEKNCQKCFMKDTVCSNTQSKTICINLCSDNSIG